MARPSVLSALLALVPFTLWAFEPGVGLSAVGALRLENPPLPAGMGPQEFDEFATVLATGDLDGDSYDDLVVGVPRDDGPLAAPLVDSGSVMYYRGSPAGPGTVPTRVIRQFPGGGLEAGDQHGAAIAICDFNADGFDDLAVGAPEESFGTIVAGGAVFLYPGTPSGPDAGFLFFSQDTTGIPDQVEASDRFGAALACGDFDDDGFDDLAIGAPGETIEPVDLAGWIVAIPGSVTGLVPAGSIAFSQAEPLILSDPESGDLFGSSLAVGNFDGDAFDDLAVGSPGENIAAGAVHVLFGSATDLTATGSMLIDDESLGGLSEANDEFGKTLAIGDFDGDHYDDLVIGIPRESYASSGGPVLRAGFVVVAYGSPNLPAPGRVEYWAENNIFVAGTSEVDDHFGDAIATGDFDGDGFDDLAVGHPGEAVLFHDDGTLTVMLGSATGLDRNRARRFAPGADGVPGPPLFGSGDRRFAAALGAGDLDGDGADDLVVGVPEEDTPDLERAGSAAVLFGALFADGFESEDTGCWSPQSLAGPSN